jgi:hypothetical protein
VHDFAFAVWHGSFLLVMFYTRCKVSVLQFCTPFCVGSLSGDGGGASQLGFSVHRHISAASAWITVIAHQPTPAIIAPNNATSEQWPTVVPATHYDGHADKANQVS